MCVNLFVTFVLFPCVSRFEILIHRDTYHNHQTRKRPRTAGEVRALPLGLVRLGVEAVAAHDVLLAGRVDRGVCIGV